MAPIKSLFLGILAALFSLVAEVTFSIFLKEGITPDFFSQLSKLLVISVLVEEIFKYAVIYKSFYALEKRKDIIINSLFLGLGFSAIEIALNIINNQNFDSFLFLLLAGIMFVHILTAGFSGYLLSKKSGVYFTAIRATLVNVIVHFSYNLAIIYFV
ncbi:MAG TPA: PrsW family glutamic-type intramembrane protease [Candidatus Moranbacteria bacterium]|nr:PrsW family glutamic-type intramembrane protease [Candidatus Moranbacteria bacterium]